MSIENHTTEITTPNPDRTTDESASAVSAASFDLKDARITGTEVHYCVLCPRKLWWFTHGIEQEHSGGSSASTGQENVALGQLLHQEAYPEARRKDILIDDLIRLDFTEGGAVHEIKKSRGALKATRMQLLYYLYYLYYLKHEKGIETNGVIDFPKERRRETLELTPDAEREVEYTLEETERVRHLLVPPAVPDPMPVCKKCAYQDLCWG